MCVRDDLCWLAAVHRGGAGESPPSRRPSAAFSSAATGGSIELRKAGLAVGSRECMRLGQHTVTCHKSDAYMCVRCMCLVPCVACRAVRGECVVWWRHQCAYTLLWTSQPEELKKCSPWICVR
jgi:hypothetical protein